MEIIEKTYLKSTSFQLLHNWSVQYLLESKFSYNENFELTPIGKFLKRNKTPIDIEDAKEYKRVTIKVNNGGIFLRDIELGKNIGTKKQFLIKKGQFLLSKIDARNGAFGVVPGEVDGAIITGNFWTFDVDYSKINPYFLALITTTPEFIRFSENASNGTTNRHYLQEDLFLAQKIPLPPLSEQNRIVEAYNKKINQAKELEQKAKELEEGVEEYLIEKLVIQKNNKKEKTSGLNIVQFSKLDIWGADKLLRGGIKEILESTIYENRKLNSLVYVNPRTDLSNIEDNDSMSFIPMKNVSDDYGEIIIRENGKKSKSGGYTKFKNGDLIWARITPCMQNGKSAVVSDLANGLGYGSTEFHVLRKKDENLQIGYLYHILRTKIVREDAVNYFTGSAGQQRVPKSYLENLLIPVPPLSIQREIISHIEKVKTQIKEMNQQIINYNNTAIHAFENEIFKICT